jgi:Uma2 family endonuclease
MTALTLNLNSILKLTRDQFYRLCEENPDLQLERNAQGELIIMPPTGGETGRSNVNLILQLASWNEQKQLGEVFDSSTGFTLPNGADRSPDVSWVEKSRWNSLTKEQREKFIPLCPDFIIEIISPSDTLRKVQEKINRKKQEVEIYRPGQNVEILKSPQTISGETVLPDFVLNLKKIWV